MTTVQRVTPAVVDLPTAAVMMGIGRTLAYRLAKSGEWPTPLIRVGRLIKVPTQPLLDYLNGAA
jgi:predicted DNA-binding transcriptional regulator AlpA